MGLIASSLIKKHLKKVVRPANGDKLKYSFKGGRIELRDVEVNCDLFEGADLPFDFSWIRVGYVRIDLPDVLEILGAKKAIHVLIEDVFGTARPRSDYHFSEASLMRAHMENQATLALYEFLHHGSKPSFSTAALRASESEKGGKGSKKGGKMDMLTSLLTKSIDLINIKLNRVHLRVIHDTPVPHSTSKVRPCFIGVAIRCLDIVGEKPEAELNPLLLMKRKKRKMMRATGKKWICKEIHIQGLTVYAGADRPAAAAADTEVNPSPDGVSASQLWGMPARRWMFTPLPKMAHAWTCDVCKRKKTPSGEHICRVCGTHKGGARRRTKERLSKSSADATPRESRAGSAEDEIRLHGAEHARLSDHFSKEMGLLFRSQQERAAASSDGDFGWRTMGMVQPPAAVEEHAVVISPTDIDVELIINHTMSKKFPISKDRERIPILDVKVRVRGGHLDARPDDNSLVIPPSPEKEAPMRVTLNPRTISPLLSLLDAIGQYNTRALVWKYKPRLQPTPSLTTEPPQVTFLRPLPLHDVAMSTDGSHLVATSQRVEDTGETVTPSARCRLWWRYAIRGTVLQVRRRLRIETVNAFIDHVDQNFATSMELHRTTGAPLGNFETWLDDEICRVDDRDLKIREATVAGSSNFVRQLVITRLFRAYVLAFRVTESSDRSSKIKAARSSLDHLEFRLSCSWQPDADPSVIKRFRKFTRKALLVFAQRSKGGADVPHGSPGTARSPRMSHVSSTESMVSNPSDSSLASTASVSPRAAGRGTMPAVSSGDLRLLFQEIDNKYEATKQPREGKTDADADWESALSELERMGATDQILALDVSASVCVALAMNPSTESASSATATTVACRTSRSLCSIVLENIHARVVQRLKYVQLAATVGGLSMYNDMHPGAPSKIMTTNSAEQFREHSRDSAPRDFLSFSFEQPRLAPSKRSQLQLTIEPRSLAATQSFRHDVEAQAAPDASKGEIDHATVSRAASFKLPGSSTSSGLFEEGSGLDLGDVDEVVDEFDDASPSANGGFSNSGTSAQPDDALWKALQALCVGGWCYKKAGNDRRFKPEPRFVWLGFVEDPRKMKETERAQALAVFWDSKQPAANTAVCSTAIFDGRLCPTYRPGLKMWVRSLELLKVSRVEFGPPPFFFKHNRRSSVQLDRGHAIDAKEGISLLHYKQTDPAEPYKNTLNLVPCFTKNTDFPLFRDCGAEVMARSIANLLSRAFGLEDVFCQSESLQAALDHEAAAIAAATATVGDSASRGAPSVRRRSSYAVLPQRAATSGSGAIIDAAEEWRTTHRHSTFIKMQMKPLELVVVPKLLLGEIPAWVSELSAASEDTTPERQSRLPKDLEPTETIERGNVLLAFNPELQVQRKLRMEVIVDLGTVIIPVSPDASVDHSTMLVVDLGRLSSLPSKLPKLGYGINSSFRYRGLRAALLDAPLTSTPPGDSARNHFSYNNPASALRRSIQDHRFDSARFRLATLHDTMLQLDGDNCGSTLQQLVQNSEMVLSVTSQEQNPSSDEGKEENTWLSITCGIDEANSLIAFAESLPNASAAENSALPPLSDSADDSEIEQICNRLEACEQASTPEETQTRRSALVRYEMQYGHVKAGAVPLLQQDRRSNITVNVGGICIDVLAAQGDNEDPRQETILRLLVENIGLSLTQPSAFSTTVEATIGTVQLLHLRQQADLVLLAITAEPFEARHSKPSFDLDDELATYDAELQEFNNTLDSDGFSDNDTVGSHDGKTPIKRHNRRAAIAFRQTTLESALAPNFDESDADVQTSLSIAEVTVAVDEGLLNLFDHLMLLQFPQSDDKDNAESKVNVDDDLDDNKRSASRLPRTVLLSHWVSSHALRAVNATIDVVRVSVPLLEIPPEQRHETPSDIRHKTHLVAEVRGASVSLLNEVCYTHIAGSLGQIQVFVDDAVATDDAPRRYPFLRMGFDDSAAGQADAQRVPCISATLSTTQIPSAHGAPLPDVSHTTLCGQRALFALVQRQKPYYDKNSIAQSCSTAHCVISELEIFAQPRMLSRTLLYVEHVSSLLSSLTKGHNVGNTQANVSETARSSDHDSPSATDEPGVVESPTKAVSPNTPSSETHEPKGAMDSLARVLRALPSVNLELRSLRFMAADFDIFQEISVTDVPACPLQYNHHAVLTSELRCGSCIVFSVDDIVIHCGAEHRYVHWKQQAVVPDAAAASHDASTDTHRRTAATAHLEENSDKVPDVGSDTTEYQRLPDLGVNVTLSRIQAWFLFANRLSENAPTSLVEGKDRSEATARKVLDLTWMRHRARTVLLVPSVYVGLQVDSLPPPELRLVTDVRIECVEVDASMGQLTQANALVELLLKVINISSPDENAADTPTADANLSKDDRLPGTEPPTIEKVSSALSNFYKALSIDQNAETIRRLAQAFGENPQEVLSQLRKEFPFTPDHPNRATAYDNIVRELMPENQPNTITGKSTKESELEGIINKEFQGTALTSLPSTIDFICAIQFGGLILNVMESPPVTISTDVQQMVDNTDHSSFALARLGPIRGAISVVSGPFPSDADASSAIGTDFKLQVRLSFDYFAAFDTRLCKLGAVHDHARIAASRRQSLSDRMSGSKLVLCFGKCDSWNGSTQPPPGIDSNAPSRPMLNFSLSLNAVLFRVESTAELITALQVPGNSQLKIGFQVGPAVVVLSDFIPSLLAKLSFFDEFSTDMPYNPSSTMQDAFGVGVDTDSGGESTEEAGDLQFIHQLINGQALVLSDGETSTVYAAAVIVNVDLQLDGLSVLCKNERHQSNRTSGNEYLRVQVNNVAVEVNNSCTKEAALRTISADGSCRDILLQKLLSSSECHPNWTIAAEFPGGTNTWTFAARLANVNIDTFQCCAINGVAARDFLRYLIHGEKIKTLLFNFEEHGQTLFLTTKEDLMTFLGNATDSQGYHNWSAKLWNGATHSIMDPFGFDITSTIALEWTLPTASDGPDASPSRTDSSQPHVFVSIKFDLKCRSKIVMDVSLDLIENYGATLNHLFSMDLNGVELEKEDGRAGSNTSRRADSLAHQNAALERHLRRLYSRGILQANEMSVFMAQYAFAPLRQQRDLLRRLVHRSHGGRRSRQQGAGIRVSRKWRSVSITAAARLPFIAKCGANASNLPSGQVHNEEGDSEEAPSPTPLYILHAVEANVIFPPTSISVISHATTTPIGVEIILHEADIVAQVFPTPGHRVRTSSDLASRQYFFDVGVEGKLHVQVDYLALHAKPILEPWKLSVAFSATQQSSILFGKDIHAVDKPRANSSAASELSRTLLSLRAKSMLTLRLDYDYLRGLLHLVGEVQRLDISEVAMSNSESEQSSINTASTVQGNDNEHRPGTDSHGAGGLGVLNLTGLPLHCRLSQFRFSTTSMPEEMGAHNHSEHTTQWKSVPTLSTRDDGLVGDDNRFRQAVPIPGTVRYRSPHGDLLDVELEIRTDMQQLQNALGRSELAGGGNLARWKALSITSYSLRPMSNMIDSKYYAVLQMLKTQATRHRFHWFVAADSNTSEHAQSPNAPHNRGQAAVPQQMDAFIEEHKPNDFTLNPELCFESAPLNASICAVLPRELLQEWAASGVSLKEVREHPERFSLPRATSNVRPWNFNNESERGRSVGWHHVERGDFVFRLNNVCIPPNKAWSSLLQDAVASAEVSSFSPSAEQHKCYFVDVIRPAETQSASIDQWPPIPRLAIEFDVVNSVYTLGSCVTIVNDLKEIWSSYNAKESADGSQPPEIHIEMQCFSQDQSQAEDAPRDLVVIAQNSSCRVPLAWLAQDAMVAFRLRFVHFVQGQRKELVSKEWSSKFPLAHTSMACVARRRAMKFTVPEHQMSSEFPFHCVLQVRSRSKGLVEWALEPVAVLQNTLPVPICFCIVTDVDTSVGHSANAVSAESARGAGSSHFICPTCKKGFETGQMLIKHCSVGCAKPDKKAAAQESRRWRKDFKKQMKQVGVKGLDFQAMKKIKDISSSLHCPACALPFQTCEAFLRHVSVHAGLKMSSVSGILPPAASRGITICDEARFEKALFVCGIPETDLTSMSVTAQAGMTQKPSTSGTKKRRHRASQRRCTLSQATSISEVGTSRIAFCGFTKFSKLVGDKEREITLYPTASYHNSRGALHLHVATEVVGDVDDDAQPPAASSKRASKPITKSWKSGATSFVLAVTCKLWIINRTGLTVMPNAEYYEITPVGGCIDRRFLSGSSKSLGTMSSANESGRAAAYSLQMLSVQKELRVKLRSEGDIARAAMLRATANAEERDKLAHDMATSFAQTSELLSLKTPWSDKIEVDWEKREESSHVLSLREGPNTHFVSSSISAAPGVFARTQVVTLAPTFVIFNHCSYVIQIAVHSGLLAHRNSSRSSAESSDSGLPLVNDPSFMVTIEPGNYAESFFAPSAVVRMRSRVLKGSLPASIFPEWSQWSAAFNFLSLRAGSERIGLGKDVDYGKEKKRAKVEAAARASARAQNQILSVSHPQLRHARTFLDHRLCNLQVVKVSGLNNKSVPLDDITFWFEDVSKEQSTESSNAPSRSMRYPNVRSLRQLHALDEALRAMAPQSFSVIPNPYSDIAVLRAASLASSSPLMKSRTACEKLSEYFQRLMDVNIACKSKILLDFIVGPAMDVTRAKSYYRMETKQNPHFQAQRLVKITPAQSSHLLPYVINNKSSFWWLRIRCASDSSSEETTLPSKSDIASKLEELRGVGASKETTLDKFRSAAQSFKNLFRTKQGSARARARTESTSSLTEPASDSELAKSQHLIWDLFPEHVETDALPFFSLAAQTGTPSQRRRLGLESRSDTLTSASSRVVPPLSSSVFCPNNGGYDVFDIFIYDDLLGSPQKVRVSHGFAKSLEVRESTQVDRKIEATLSNGARIQLHIRKQHGCQNIITVTDAGLDGDAFLKKQKLQIMKVHERIRLLPSAEPLISTRAGFLIAMKNPLLQKQILYGHMLQSLHKRLHVNRTLPMETPLVSQSQQVPTDSLRQKSRQPPSTVDERLLGVTKGMSAEVDLRGLQVLCIDTNEIARISMGRVSLKMESTGNHKSMLRASIEYIQVDNQLPDAYFPVVFEAAGGSSQLVPSTSERSLGSVSKSSRSRQDSAAKVTDFMTIEADVRHHTFTNVVETLHIKFPHAREVQRNNGKVVADDGSLPRRRGAGVILKLDSKLLVLVLKIFQRVGLMQERLLESSPASRLYKWFERGADFSSIIREMAAVSRAENDVPGGVAAPEHDLHVTAQEDSILTDADADAAAAAASKAAAAGGKQLVFGSVDMEQLSLLVSIANLNNRKLSAALGMRGFARGVLKVIARLDTAAFALPSFSIDDALISFEGLLEIIMHTHSQAFVNRLLQVLLNPSDARTPSKDSAAVNRRLSFPHFDHVRSGQGYFLARALGYPPSHYIFHQFVIKANDGPPVGKGQKAPPIPGIEIKSHVRYCLLITTSAVHLVEIKNLDTRFNRNGGFMQLCNFDSVVKSVYTFGLPHAMGPPSQDHVCVIRNVFRVSHGCWFDFFDDHDDVHFLFEHKAGADHFCTCLQHIVNSTPRQRNVLDLRHSVASGEAFKRSS